MDIPVFRSFFFAPRSGGEALSSGAGIFGATPILSWTAELAQVLRAHPLVQEFHEEGTGVDPRPPGAGSPPGPWRCPQCGQILLSREAAPPVPPLRFPGRHMMVSAGPTDPVAYAHPLLRPEKRALRPHALVGGALVNSHHPCPVCRGPLPPGRKTCSGRWRAALSRQQPAQAQGEREREIREVLEGCLAAMKQALALLASSKHNGS